MVNQVRLDILDYLYGGKSLPDYQYMAIGLSTTKPNHDGTQFTEPSGNGYQRVVINNDTTTWANATTDDGIVKKVNNIEIEFPISTGPWGEILYWGIFAAPTEQDTPELIWYGPLNLADPYIGEDTIVRIPVGGIEIMAGSIRSFVPLVRVFNASDYAQSTTFSNGETFGSEYEDMFYVLTNTTNTPRIIEYSSDPKPLALDMPAGASNIYSSVRNNHPLSGKYRYRIRYLTGSTTISPDLFVALSTTRLSVSDYNVPGADQIPVYLVLRISDRRLRIRSFDGENFVSAWDGNNQAWDDYSTSIIAYDMSPLTFYYIDIIGSESGLRVTVSDDDDNVLMETDELSYTTDFGGNLDPSRDHWIYLGKYSLDSAYNSKVYAGTCRVVGVYYEREGD